MLVNLDLSPLIVHARPDLVEAIDNAIAADGGAKYRAALKQLVPATMNELSITEDEHREHLGASLVGHGCDRYVQMSFRWVFKAPKSGRMLRLLNRGHMEEARVYAALTAVGADMSFCNTKGAEDSVAGLSAEEARQWGFSQLFGIYSGRCDGAIRNVPGLTGVYVLEVKTHSTSSFNQVKSKGVLQAKPRHAKQCHVLAHNIGLDGAIYVAVCKETDELYIEYLPLDAVTAKTLYTHTVTKAVFDTAPIHRFTNVPTNWRCRICDAKHVCWGSEPSVKNCRSCAHSRVSSVSGDWVCGKDETDTFIHADTIRVGCDYWFPLFSYEAVQQ